MKKIKKQKIIILVVFLLLFMVSWLIWGNLSVETSRLTITSKDLPKEFDKFSVAHISDLHNAEYGKNNEKLINILKSESPNMIAITGDLIDSNNTDLEVAISFAQQAAKIAPCYFVAGNHEAWVGSQYEELKTSLENVGVTVLQNEAIELNYGDECIQLVGLNDPDFSERDNFLSESILETKLSQMNIGDGFTMLLSHRPECFNVYQNKNIDLVLSGTHTWRAISITILGGVIAPNQGFFRNMTQVSIQKMKQL